MQLHQQTAHASMLPVLSKEIQGIEDLKASRYWALFTARQKQRWERQLEILRWKIQFYQSN